MTDDQLDVMGASGNDVNEFENQASVAAHAKFTEWHKRERDQQPRRVLIFTFAGVVITTATALLVFLNRS